MNSTVKWLIKVPGRKKLYIVLLTVVQALHGASGVLYALLLKMIVDSATGRNAAGFWQGIILIILLVAAQLGLRAVIRWLTELGRAEFENIFKLRLTETLLKKDYLTVSSVHSGEWLNRLTNDTRVVAESYVDIIPGIAGMLVKLISALVMIIVIEPRFAVILIPAGLILLILTWLFRKVIKKLHKNVQESDGRLRIFLQERLGSMLMIRSFAAEKQTAINAEENMTEHRNARMRKLRFSNICNIGYGAAMNGMYLLGVGWCGYGILTGTVTFGTLTAVTQLISQIQSPVASITGYIPKYYTMLASAERLMEAESFPEEILDGALALSEVQALYHDVLSSVELKDVSFTYYPPVENLDGLTKQNMPAVLDHVSLSVAKGEYVAFTGQSGCGKTSVLKLMMCVYNPDAGERVYTGNDGSRGDLTGAHRRLFAYVPQDNQLMSGTIREIVSFADPKAATDGERLRRALKIACAEEFVDALDDGVDTVLGERGTGLSEGQMQRLAIARAVFSDSPVLLLDEATSALDAETEGRLLNNLRSMTDKTVVIVTHRNSALAICDRQILFTADGIQVKELRAYDE